MQRLGSSLWHQLDDEDQRVLALVLLTFTGMGIGVAGDVAAGIEVSGDDLFGAVLFSPLLAVVGGRMAGEGMIADLFLLGGLLFWPVWGVLAWRWMTTGSALVGVLIVVWSAQGFFKLVHRFGMVMSA